MYNITHNDGTKFTGGEPHASKWNLIDKPIKKLDYIFGNKRIVLEKYDMYNHVVEYTAIMGNGCVISKIILMGLNGDVVTKITFNIKKRSIERQNAKLGYEYNNKITTGWKKGIECDEAGFFNLLSCNHKGCI